MGSDTLTTMGTWHGNMVALADAAEPPRHEEDNNQTVTTKTKRHEIFPAKIKISHG